MKWNWFDREGQKYISEVSIDDFFTSVLLTLYKDKKTFLSPCEMEVIDEKIKLVDIMQKHIKDLEEDEK